MRFSLAVAALAACAPTAFAAAEVEGFTLEQEYTGRLVAVKPQHDLIRAWLRYNGTVPQHILDAEAGKSKGTVKNTPEAHDKEYLTPISIGTPAKKFVMDIDTGSSDLWVYTSKVAAGARKGHTLYQPAKSSTSKKLPGEHWSAKYGSGKASGPSVYTDKVSLGGVSFPHQAVELASKVSAQFGKDKGSDGLFGFGFSNINTVKPNQQKTWFSNVGPSLANNVFCANLNHNKPGAYDIGFINPAHHTGSVHYTPVTKVNGFWQFTTDGYSVGSKKYDTRFPIAIADTGTSLIYVAPTVAQTYYKNVRTAQSNSQVGGIIYKCSTKLPDFAVDIGGSKRVVPGALIKYLEVGTISGVPYCLGGIQESPQQGLTILGDIFLKSQYVVFDQGAMKIGFAHKK